MSATDLDGIRDAVRAQRRRLPERHRRIEDPAPYDGRISDGLERTTGERRRTSRTDRRRDRSSRSAPAWI